MSRLARDGTADPVSRDQILRHARGQGNVHFPCSADHEQDWQPYPVDPYSAICDGHTYIHTYIPGTNNGNIYIGKHCTLPGVYQRQHIQSCHMSCTRRAAVMASDESTHATGEFLGARITTKGSAAPLFFLGRLYKGGYAQACLARLPAQYP